MRIFFHSHHVETFLKFFGILAFYHPQWGPQIVDLQHEFLILFERFGQLAKVIPNKVCTCLQVDIHTLYLPRSKTSILYA